MNVKTYRARTLPDALRLVRDEMGPDARVLSTERKANGLWDRLTGRRRVEVTALQAAAVSAEAAAETAVAEPPMISGEGAMLGHSEPVGSRPGLSRPLASESFESKALGSSTLGSSPLGCSPLSTESVVPVAPRRVDHASSVDEGYESLTMEDSYRHRFRRFAAEEKSSSLLESMMEQHDLAARPATSGRMPSSLFRLFTDLIDADVDDRFARMLVDELHCHSTPAELADVELIKEKSIEMLTRRVQVAPRIGAYPSQRRVVALIGPTGVGKTTTIAKLAANLRLRDKRRVGLITVDTYRIAAVDQLRAYADIIDLPMEVVTTPREMRAAVATLADLDIVLIDTAGRSPRDEIQIQELKAMLSESQPDEVQLVLSSVSNARHLTRLVEQFQPASPTSLLLTKLDESMSFGHLLPILCNSDLPLSYTTHGQNVPDDIQPADPPKLIESVFQS